MIVGHGEAYTVGCLGDHVLRSLVRVDADVVGPEQGLETAEWREG